MKRPRQSPFASRPEATPGPRQARFILALLASFGASACADKEPPPPPPCEIECKDAIALRALRETAKFAFNKTFQGKPYGMHDETTTEFIRGSARVFGEATSDPALGTTKVDVTYEFTLATYLQKDIEPRENFIMGVQGTLTQKGTLAVQPSSPTSLIMHSDSISLAGQVYDPLVPYSALECTLDLNQNGNRVSGWLCGRFAGFEF